MTHLYAKIFSHLGSVTVQNIFKVHAKCPDISF